MCTGWYGVVIFIIILPGLLVYLILFTFVLGLAFGVPLVLPMVVLPFLIPHYLVFLHLALIIVELVDLAGLLHRDEQLGKVIQDALLFL